MYPVGFHIALDATKRLAQSALPDAPVLPDEVPRASLSKRCRIALASTLRALAVRADNAAERVEPPAVTACCPSRGGLALQRR
ncbi:MAG TPA: hypothetical protein VF053_18880 [Streptosporangiales bacterium]